MNKLQEHIQNSPLVRAAIIETVHRFYYDRILSDKLKDLKELTDTQAGDILDKLWSIHSDWRHTLLTYPQRYKGSAITSLPKDQKPKLADIPFVVDSIIYQ